MGLAGLAGVVVFINTVSILVGNIERKNNSEIKPSGPLTVPPLTWPYDYLHAETGIEAQGLDTL